MEKTTVILLALLICGVKSGPTGLRNKQCSLQCNGNDKFDYEIGKAYTYEYKASTKVQLVDASKQSEKNEISAFVTITPISSCDYVLSLSKVQLHGSSRSNIFAPEVEKNALQFSIQNGKIEQLCMTSSEPSWVSNFKKGILSQFQNTMQVLVEDQTSIERDISGACETIYSVLEKNAEIKIMKKKSLSTCTDRTNSPNKLSALGYSADSLVQNLQVLDSSQICYQYISEGLIRQVECFESHQHKPFEKVESAATTLVESKLTLIMQEPVTTLYPEEFEEITDLSFTIAVESGKKANELERVRKILRNLEYATTHILKKETPYLFSQLVTSLKDLTTEDLAVLFHTSTEKQKIFLTDALPLIQTEASMTLLAHSVNDNFPSHKAQLWFTSLAFVENPTRGMFAVLLPLLEKQEKRILLPVSSMVHKYCSRNTDCESEPEIQNILRILESNLKGNCKTATPEEREIVLLSLKALGNAGRFVNSESVLKHCYFEENDMEVKIAAINAWRRLPCSSRRDQFYDTFLDTTLDNEIRITSYLALMQCPDLKLIKTMRDQLSSEDVSHVSSFVWTHLSNLQESASPDKQWIRDLIGEEVLQKKYTSDNLKLSKNYESSFYLPEQKFGATFESNVITSSNSVIPRSSMFNFTVNLFGESINLFEVGGRIEGFESYIEQFFGPDGYYPEETVAAFVKQLREQSQGNRVDDSTNITPENPEGSVYLKMLGNELMYKRFYGSEDILPNLGFSNVKEMVMQIMSGNKIDVVNNYNIIDTEFEFPSIIGLPLKLKMIGSASLGLKMNGQFNFAEKDSFLVNGLLNPSASVHIDSQMIIDNHVSKSGLKVSSKLHSSSAIEGKLVFKKGKLLDMEVRIPQDRVEIFEISDEYFKIEDSAEVILPGTVIEECLPVFSRSLGLEICTEKSSASSLINKLYVQKTDSIKAYVFKLVNEETNKVIHFDLVGSRESKRWSLAYTKNGPKFDVDIHTPHGKGNGAITYDITENRISTRGKINLNDHIYESIVSIERDSDSDVKRLSAEIMFDSSHFENKIFNLKSETEYDVNTKSFKFSKKMSSLIPQLLFIREMEGELPLISEHNVRFKYGSQLSVNSQMNFDSLPGIGFQLEASNESPGVYSVLYSSNFFGSKTKVEGNLDFEIFDSNIELNAKGSIAYNDEPYYTSAADLIWNLAVNKNQFRSKLSFNNNGDVTFINAYLTRSSFQLESTLLHKIVNLEMNVKETDDEVTGTLTFNWERISLEAAGKINSKLVEGNIIYNKNVVKFHTQLLDRGMNLMVELSPTLKFTFNGECKPSFQEISASTALETPFEGWRKQEAKVSLKTSAKNINIQVSLEWGNEDMGSLLIEIANKSNRAEVNYLASMRFLSTIEGYELVDAALSHTHSHSQTSPWSIAAITSNLEGKWNSKKIKGHFHSKPTSTGREINFNLDTPYTHDMSGYMKYKNVENDPSMALDFSIRSQTSKILLRVNTVDSLSVRSSFTCVSPYLPEISLKMDVSNKVGSKKFDLEGIWNDMKISSLANCDLSYMNREGSCKILINLIKKSNKIFNLSFSKTLKKNGQFNGNFEISFPLILDENIRGNYEGQFTSLSFITLNGRITGPSFSGKLKMSHKYSQNSFKTDGIIDINNFDIKFFHTLNLKDEENWESMLEINGLKIKNSLYNAEDSLLTTEIEYNENKLSAELKRSFAKMFDLEANIKSTWTAPIKLIISHEKDTSTNSITRLYAYYNDRYILLVRNVYENSKEAQSNVLEIAANLPNFSPFAYDLKYRKTSATEISSRLAYENFKFTTEMSNKNDFYKGKLILEHNNRDPLITTVAYRTLANGFHTILEYQTPFSVLRKGLFEMTYEKSVGFHNLKTKIVQNENEVSVFGKLDNDSISLTLNTPIRQWEQIQLTLSHKEELYRANILINQDVIEAKFKSVLKSNRIKSRIEISLPFKGYEENSLFVDLNFGTHNLIQFTGNCKVGHFIGNAEVQMSSQKTHHISAKLTSNVPNLKNIDLELYLENYFAKLNVYLNDKKFYSEMVLTENENGINIQFSVNSTILNWESIELSANIENKVSPYKVSALVNKNGYIEHYSFVFKRDKSSIKVEVDTPFGFYGNLQIYGSNDLSDKIEFSLLFSRYEDVFTVNGIADFTAIIPSIKLIADCPYTNNPFKFTINGSLSDQKQVEITTEHRGETYFIKIKVDAKSKRGEIVLQSRIPFMPMLPNINIVYDLISDLMFVKAELDNNGEITEVSLENKFTADEFYLDIKTPIKDYREILINGKYQKQSAQSEIFGKIMINNRMYIYEGLLEENNDGYHLSASSPHGFAGPIQADLVFTKNEIKLIYNYNYEVKEIEINYSFNPNDISIKIETPFESFANIETEINFVVENEKAIGNTFIQVNSDRYEFRGEIFASTLESNVYVNLIAPGRAKEIEVRFAHIFSDEKKFVQLIYNDENSFKEFRIEIEFDGTKYGIFKLTDSFFNFGTYGAEYNFEIVNFSKTEAYMILYENMNVYKLGLISKFKKNKVDFQILTPFSNYETFGIYFEYVPKENKMNLQLLAGENSSKFYIEAGKRMVEAVLETPIPALRSVKFSANYELSDIEKSVSVECSYNEVAYGLTASYSAADSIPKIYVRGISPYTAIELVEFTAIFDVNSPENLIVGSLTFNSQKYELEAGYYFDELKGLVKFLVASDKIKAFEVKAKYDLLNEYKFLNIFLEMNGYSRLINISGKLYDYEMDFEMESPFAYLGNFKTRGSVSRSKRSVNLQMMNDHHHGGIVASFNSFKLHAKTPFKKANDVHLEISKNANGLVVDYKRNNNKVFFNLNAETQKKALAIKINSEIPGWELLALAGRIDLSEALLYVKGEKNDENIVISGSGSLARKVGKLSITSTSGYSNYKEVTTNIDYNAVRNTFIIESTSSSSDFKILLEVKRGLTIDVFVPNAQENTVAKGKLTPFKGNLKASSRFPFLRTFTLNYETKLGPVITSNTLFELNGLKMIELEFERNSKDNTAHLMFHGRRKNSHSMIHFHRDGWKKLEFVFERNGKQFKVDVTGTGNPPQKATYNYEIKNSFREEPREITGKLTVDRTVSPKEVDLSVDYKNWKKFSVNLKYNADLNNMRKGDFVFKLTRRTKDVSPFDNISGRWDVQDKNNIVISVKSPVRQHEITGKIGLYETNVVITTDLFKGKNFIVQWKFSKVGYARDHFLKIGSEDRFVMFKLKGTIKDIYNGDVTGALRASRFMKNDLEFTAKWSRSEKGLTGGGKFTMGKYSGSHTLHNLKRDASERAAKVHWEATSNIKDFNNIKLIGEYSLRKRKIDLKLSWDKDEIFIKGGLDNFSDVKSENSLKFHLPAIGVGEVTVSHDFTDPLSKKINVVGQIGGKNIEYKIRWTRNEDFTVLDLNADIKSGILGSLLLKVNYDIQSFSDAKGSLAYTRNDNKFVNINWFRKKTENNAKSQLVFESHFKSLPSLTLTGEVSWESGFKLNIKLEYNDKVIETKLDIGDSQTTASFTTPYESISNIDVVITYDIKKQNSKTVTLNYKRGDRSVEGKLELKKASPKTGSLVFSMSTPFEVIKNVNFDADWNDGVFNAVYKRNDIEVKATGTAKVKTGNSSFNVAFTLPSGKNIKLEFAYDLMNFIRGTGSTTKTILKNKIQIEDELLDFTIKGHRTSEKIYIEVDGQKSFGKISTFYLLLDSELNLNKREGHLEIKANDFHFDMKNTFEKRPNGFYARSQIKSTLTKLPGITYGVGKDGDSFIFTTGWGDEREITITFKGKDHFRKGFYGSIDLPYRKLLGLEYDITYEFPSNDEMKAHIKIQVREGEFIEADIVYNSHGVKGRLSSPWTGKHSVRARRSVSEQHLFTDIGVDGYGMFYEIDNRFNSFKRNVKIEGELFGEKILFEGFVDVKDIKNLQGKLTIKSPIKSFKAFDVHFKLLSSDEQFHGEVSSDLIDGISFIVDVNLHNGINSDVMMKFGNSVYKIQSNIARSNSTYQGDVTLRTTHSTFAYASFDFNLKITSLKNVNGKIGISLPSGNYVINVLSQLEDKSYLLDWALTFPGGSTYDSSTYYTFDDGNKQMAGKSSISENNIVLFTTECKVNLIEEKLDFKLDSDVVVITVAASKDGSSRLLKANIDIANNKFAQVDYVRQNTGKCSIELNLVCNNNLMNYKLEKLIQRTGDRLEGAITSSMRFKVPPYQKDITIKWKRNEIDNSEERTNIEDVSLSFGINEKMINIYKKLFMDTNSFTKSYKLEYVVNDELKEHYLYEMFQDVGQKYHVKFDSIIFRDYVKHFDGLLKCNFEKEYGLSMKLLAPIVDNELLSVEMAYEKSDLNNFNFYASPLALHLKSTFGLSLNTYVADLLLKSNFERLKQLEMSMKFPTKEFSPELSANVNGNKYALKANTVNENDTKTVNISTEILSQFSELGVKYKHKAPYEVSLEFKEEQEHEKFVVIFDSSFILLKDAVTSMF